MSIVVGHQPNAGAIGAAAYQAGLGQYGLQQQQAAQQLGMEQARLQAQMQQQLANQDFQREQFRAEVDARSAAAQQALKDKKDLEQFEFTAQQAADNAKLQNKVDWVNKQGGWTDDEKQAAIAQLYGLKHEPTIPKVKIGDWLPGNTHIEDMGDGMGKGVWWTDPKTGQVEFRHISPPHNQAQAAPPEGFGPGQVFEMQDQSGQPTGDKAYYDQKGGLHVLPRVKPVQEKQFTPAEYARIRAEVQQRLTRIIFKNGRAVDQHSPTPEEVDAEVARAMESYRNATHGQPGAIQPQGQPGALPQGAPTGAPSPDTSAADMYRQFINDHPMFGGERAASSPMEQWVHDGMYTVKSQDDYYDVPAGAMYKDHEGHYAIKKSSPGVRPQPAPEGEFAPPSRPLQDIGGMAHPIGTFDPSQATRSQDDPARLLGATAGQLPAWVRTPEDEQAYYQLLQSYGISPNAGE